MTSYVYKHAAGTDISVDVYLPKTASTKPLKVLLWFHGGGLLMSHRGNIAPHLKRSAERHSLCFVSADYRLAPQASLPDILEDVRDCAAWCRKDLKQIVAAQGFLLDDTLVIGGASAGKLLLYVLLFLIVLMFCSCCWQEDTCRFSLAYLSPVLHLLLQRC